MIVVVGSLNLDLVAHVPRLPEPGETLLASGYAEHPGGKGANQAVAAARAGGRVAMIGRVGRDEAGARLRDGLHDEGIDVRSVLETDAPTGRALIEVDDAGRNRIVVVPGANARLRPDDVGGPPLDDASVLLLQREIPDETVLASAQRVHARGGRVLLNVAPAGPVAAELLACVDVLLVNEAEAAGLLAERDTADVSAAPEAAAAALAGRFGGTAVITLGAEGLAFAGPEDRGRLAGLSVEVRDTTAAGDAFAGALAARLAEGAALRPALRFANAAGACACRREGAQPSIPRREAIDALLREAQA